MKIGRVKKNLRGSGCFKNIDHHFASFMQRLSGSNRDEIYWTAAILSSHTREGHICLNLSDLSDADFLKMKFEEALNESVPVLPLEAVRDALIHSAVVGEPGAFKPMILDTQDRLYLNRYWQYQENLAAYIRPRMLGEKTVSDSQKIRHLLAKYFPETATVEPDWQKIAAAVALLKKVCVITGGPGTGKTFTVAKIIALLLETDANLRIKLGAPTGKAANRLLGSIQRVMETLDLPDAIRAAFPKEALTIHRMLGFIRHSPQFRHHAENPLDVDVVIIDEASMVDLALMAKLVDALPPQAKLILLGDNHQLASVEAGAVLADICGPGELQFFSKDFTNILEKLTDQKLNRTTKKSDKMQDCLVELQYSYRFAAQKGIGALSESVNSGEVDAALEIIKNSEFRDVSWQPLQSALLLQRIHEIFSGYTISDDPAKVFEQFSKGRILCALREGPYGVRELNRQIERFVKKQLGIKSDASWYPGQPILITENDYSLKLFNGDLGIVLPDPENAGHLKVYFEDEEGTFRKIQPIRLPDYESAFAMTVHKSQGSEFEHVLLVLPENDNPIVTRELVYTAITRAVQKIEIWGSEEMFRSAVQRNIRRSSGLYDALRRSD